MADTRKEVFLTVVQRLFSNWTALRMAVEHDMGSISTAIQFCVDITELMFLKHNLPISEVITFLEDYMDRSFSTELEDGSAEEVAEILVKFYQYSAQTQSEELVRTELEQLPPLQSWLLSSHRKYHSALNHDNSYLDSNSSEEMDTNEDEEGWTTVRSGRKK